MEPSARSIPSPQQQTPPHQGRPQQQQCTYEDRPAQTHLFLSMSYPAFLLLSHHHNMPLVAVGSRDAALSSVFGQVPPPHIVEQELYMDQVVQRLRGLLQEVEQEEQVRDDGSHHG